MSSSLQSVEAAAQICTFAACSLCQILHRHHQMEYAMPAITTPLRTIVTMLAVWMESCQSCFGSNAMPVSLAAAEREH